MMNAVVFATRPIYEFQFAREWAAHNGPEVIGPWRMFQRDAINDLPAEAEVSECASGYNCREPYGVRPRTVFGWPKPGWRERA
jgi:hypothetical protein